MTEDELDRALERLGWKTVRHAETGETSATFCLPDRIAVALYRYQASDGPGEMHATPAVSTDRFCEACSRIHFERVDGAFLKTEFSDPELRHVPGVNEARLEAWSRRCLAWALEQDLDAALEGYAALPPSAVGILPLYHLAALALLGRAEQLKAYKSGFVKGGPPAFVPYITPDYIDRALEVSSGL